MKSQEVIYRATEIIIKHNLQRYLSAFAEYLVKNPPQLGHGFAHAIDVAIASYDLAILNRFEHPEYLFIGGLFHDIYRPSLGEAAQEDQTPGADISKQILQDLNAPQELIDYIYHALKTHDEWRKESQAPVFDLLLSIGDKIAYDARNGYAYTWSSTKLVKSLGKSMPYNTHQEAMRYFVVYQQRAWEIFTKFDKQIIGMNRAVESYLKAYQLYGDAIRFDPGNLQYWNYVVTQAKLCHEYECAIIRGLINEEGKLKLIMADSVELEDLK
jgi:hypothetical protein